MLPRPQTLGWFVLLVTGLAFLAGWLRNELSLFLLGTVFLFILVYCFLGTFFLGLLHFRKAGELSLAITCDTVNTGREAELFITPKKRFFTLPLILVRCELYLETKDGRVIRHYINPNISSSGKFSVNERGVYYGENDKLKFLDAAGFFRLSVPVRQSSGPRLWAFPNPSEEIIPLSLKSGGSEQRNEPHYRKSDDLIDHRPYIPGDDPRRINWKLYSHAPQGELFVREGEPQPPPRGRLFILIDSETDGFLYSLDEGRRAVDLLCECALTLALEYSAKGMDVNIGSSGGKIFGSHSEGGPLNGAELSVALAWPAAVYRPKADSPGADLLGANLLEANLLGANLPRIPNDKAALILALPRTTTGTALDNFLKTRSPEQEADIVFIYNAQNAKAAIEDAARMCVGFYNRKGVFAQSLKI